MIATIRVSVASDGTQGNNWSYSPSTSENGRLLVFESSANNFVPEDINGLPDIFFHDTQSKTTTQVSIASDGTPGNDSSHNPVISGNGRYAVFESYADNLVAGDTNNSQDIFVHDLQTRITRRVNVASDSTQSNGYSYVPDISGNGRYVTFASSASNLVPGDTNLAADIFVHDLQTGITSRVSIASDGNQGNNDSDSPGISSDGRYITFASYANNLVEGDTNGQRDIFVHDLQTGTTRRVNIASDGTQGNNWSYHPTISGNGRYVAFASYADNLVPGASHSDLGIFVHDLQTGNTIEIPGFYPRTYSSNNPAISNDGRYITYESELVDNIHNLWGIYLYDSQTRETTPVIENSDPTRSGYYPAISGNGRYLAFGSFADTIVSGDTNVAFDVFVKDLTTNDDFVINGTSGNDIITGSNEAEIINGNGGDDYLYGNGGNDTINGGTGNDILNGGEGNDSLDGGAGNDVYIVNNPGDRLYEAGGIDTVSTSITLTLDNNLEHLSLGGTNNLNGSGNDLNNRLTGNSGNNFLTGLSGNDTLLGGPGNDILIGSLGNDILSGGGNRDKFRFNSPTEGIDVLLDFNLQDDQIELLGTAFGLDPGILGAEALVIGTTALDQSDRLIYNPNTGELFFDADGNGTVEEVKIASMGNLLNLTANQILII
ncbi:PD40 domain-containing protein [Gloeocapsa sp. PCC 73106]|uniref:PD40 domain-containing protein n=1 Tax=Gloeocapsa sp. PCC 73106 TaxID=102232 RepID=UPI0002ACD8A3|nr:PD40 domain-containing protein [Gloeocapsa sp. PCC 73106]ELR99382.1 periplasmic component of the Tol biopolymer transport system [Gloeocapsa sp. PCC 73106]